MQLLQACQPVTIAQLEQHSGAGQRRARGAGWLGQYSRRIGMPGQLLPVQGVIRLSAQGSGTVVAAQVAKRGRGRRRRDSVPACQPSLCRRSRPTCSLTCCSCR